MDETWRENFPKRWARNQPWTKPQIAFIRKWWPTKTRNWILENMPEPSRSKFSLNKLARELNLPINYRRPPKPDPFPVIGCVHGPWQSPVSEAVAEDCVCRKDYKNNNIVYPPQLRDPAKKESPLPGYRAILETDTNDKEFQP